MQSFPIDRSKVVDAVAALATVAPSGSWPGILAQYLALPSPNQLFKPIVKKKILSALQPSPSQALSRSVTAPEATRRL
jgi:hypothetical protein